VVELAERHDTHDPRVAEPREDPPLAAEARLFARVDARDGDDLEGHVLPRDIVARPVHDTHAAAPHLALDREASRQLLREGCGHERFPVPTAKISMLTE